MYCEKCGHELEEDACFCENCGAKVSPNLVSEEDMGSDPMDQRSYLQQEPQIAQMQQSGMQQAAGQQPQQQPQMGMMSGQQPQMQQPRKPMRKSLVVAILLAVVVIIGAVIGVNLYENRKTEIDLKDYYKIGFSGTAPNGSATVDFNYEKFLRDYKGQIRTKSKTHRSDTVVIEGLISDCGLTDYSLKKDDHLSNGDEVTLTIHIDESRAAKDYNVKFKNAQIVKKVAGLDHFVTKLSELKDEDLNNLKKSAEDALLSAIASEYGGYMEAKGMKYLGGYTLLSKELEDADNKLILVYKYSVRLKDETWSETETAYWYTCFENVLITADGEAKYSMMDYNTPKSDYVSTIVESRTDEGWFSNSWDVFGYRSLALLYNDLVTRNIDRYEHEDEITDVSGSVLGASDAVSPEVNGKDSDDSKADDAEDSENVDADADGILFPNALTKKITDKEIENLSDEELQTAINDLSAMAGYVFTKKTELNEYYEQFDWYHPDENAKPSKKTLGKIGYKNYLRLVDARKDRQ